MDRALRKDADQIIKESIAAVQPDEAVKRALCVYHHGSGKTRIKAAIRRNVGTESDGHTLCNNLNHSAKRLPFPSRIGYQFLRNGIRAIRNLSPKLHHAPRNENSELSKKSPATCAGGDAARSLARRRPFECGAHIIVSVLY